MYQPYKDKKQHEASLHQCAILLLKRQSLQESRILPTAGLYADGQISGPSAYRLAPAAAQLRRRRSSAVGVRHLYADGHPRHSLSTVLI